MVHPQSPFLVYLIGLVFALQAISTDLYLPTLPAMQTGLGASMYQVQLSLTVFLLSFGLTQLFWGVLSDRWGRRPVLLLGLGLYSIAAALCFWASSMDWLILGRMVQGIGMGACAVVARAMIRDAYTKQEGPIKMSLALTILALAAIASPIVGAALVRVLPWYSAFAALLVIGVGMLLITWLWIPETLTPETKTQKGTPLIPILYYIIRHPRFQYYAMIQGIAYASLFTFLAASSFTFMRIYQFGAFEYGVLVGCNALAYFLGTFFCRRLLKRKPLAAAMRAGALLAGAAGLTLLALVHGPGLLAHLPHYAYFPHPAALGAKAPLAWWLLFAPILLYGFSHGITQPCAQATVVDPFPDAAGTAAALAGLVTTGMAFLVGYWLGWVMDGSIFPLANGMIFWSISLCLLVLVSSFFARSHALLHGHG